VIHHRRHGTARQRIGNEIMPVTLVTLGLFMFVINALMFWAAASLVSGLSVSGFGAALIGSLIYSVLQLAIDFVLERLFFHK
jgi:putative membrane protein